MVKYKTVLDKKHKIVPLTVTPFQADSETLRVKIDDGSDVPFSFLETT